MERLHQKQWPEFKIYELRDDGLQFEAREEHQYINTLIEFEQIGTKELILNKETEPRIGDRIHLRLLHRYLALDLRQSVSGRSNRVGRCWNWNYHWALILGDISFQIIKTKSPSRGKKYWILLQQEAEG
ncbi:MAG: hypothetical protein IPH53_05250 [Flavobacteriales bacterium]|nr:hypothetical protein [Flavobacteriales bacterium]